jgi:phage shock protein A
MPEEIFDLVEDLFEGIRKRKKRRDRQKRREAQRGAPPRRPLHPESSPPQARSPQAELEASYRQQRRMLEELRRSTDQVSLARQQLTERARTHERQLADFDTQAREHLERGREDLARVVLERKRLAMAQVSEFEREIDKLKEEEARLMGMEARLEAELESFWMRSQVLRSQHSSARARSRLSDATGLNGEMGNASSALDDATAHVAELNDRSRTLDGMLESGLNRDPHSRFERDLELSEVDADLETLRRQMRESRERGSNE